MPHLRFRAVKSEHIQELSIVLAKDLAQTMGTSEDNFTFEDIGTQFYSQGKKSLAYPFIEVLWFARTQVVQNLSAQVITDHVKKWSEYEDVVVVFQVLEKSAYYENGQHF